MNRYQKIIRDLTLDRLVELLLGQIGQDLYDGNLPWCPGVNAVECDRLPDNAEIPCEGCVRAWLEEDLPGEEGVAGE